LVGLDGRGAFGFRHQPRRRHLASPRRDPRAGGHGAATVPGGWLPAGGRCAGSHIRGAVLPCVFAAAVSGLPFRALGAVLAGGAVQRRVFAAIPDRQRLLAAVFAGADPSSQQRNSGRVFLEENREFATADLAAFVGV